LTQSFRSFETERLFHRERVRQFGAIERQAQRKLAMLHAALRLEDLRAPPGNRLDKLAGNRAGQYGIHINDQGRICSVRRDGRRLPRVRRARIRRGNRGIPFAKGAKPVPAKLRPFIPARFCAKSSCGRSASAKTGSRGRCTVPAPRIGEIVNCRRAITPGPALRLARYFAAPPEFWINLQT